MKHLFCIILLAAFISACAPPTSLQDLPDQPVSDNINPEKPEPQTPIGDVPMQPTIIAPQPRTQPGEKILTRGNVFINETSLLIRESYPPQITLVIAGELPTPCHKLIAIFSKPDTENNIFVDVYSVVDTEIACIQVLQPFEETIELGTFPSGHYLVYMNGEKIGEFDS